MKGRIIWIAFFCIGGMVAWFSGVIPVLPASRFSVSPGTNISRVSVEVTRGTNHVFYYRGKLRWMWNDACKRFGWRLLADCERRRSWTYESADMLWVTCRHRGEPPKRHRYEALEVTAEGRRRIYGSTGGFCDEKRGVSVSNWALLGGFEKHRGSVIHIRYNGKEIARIEVR